MPNMKLVNSNQAFKFFNEIVFNLNSRFFNTIVNEVRKLRDNGFDEEAVSLKAIDLVESEVCTIMSRYMGEENAEGEWEKLRDVYGLGEIVWSRVVSTLEN